MDITAALKTAKDLHQAGNLDHAKHLYNQLLALAPDHPEIHDLRGIVDLQQGHFGEALVHFESALAIKPDFSGTHAHKGTALLALGHCDRALSSFESALSLDPGCVDALKNRVIALNEMQRYEDVIAACNSLLAYGIQDFQATIALANALNILERYEEAIATCDHALELHPNSAKALVIRGEGRAKLNQQELALCDFEAAYALDTGLKSLLGNALYLSLQICRWDGFEEKTREVLRAVDAGKARNWPLQILAIPSSALQQRKAATLYFGDGDQVSRASVQPPAGEKIRLGYFSADFINHATSHLIGGLLKAHDRTRFEVIGIALAGSPFNPTRQRIAAAVDRMIDVSAMSEPEIVNLCRELGIHIALDLNVYMGGLPDIFARGVAPIQVNYLGCPGTSGRRCYDYIIGDSILTPPGNRSAFSEHVISLPHTYQPTDLGRYVSRAPLPRPQLGLPSSGFVFCCFNDNYKITPDVFDIWMRLLRNVEGSVLWLLECNAAAKRNLKMEAQMRGVSPDRLIFAPRVSVEPHLARHSAADLFLDTFYYNAHTTASDALWGGLPLVTRLGSTFAGRVAASLLTAAGLPELIATNSVEYEKFAFDLATQPDLLARLKIRLEENKKRCPLFDTERYARNIESAYLQMWENYKSGAPLADIAMSDISPMRGGHRTS